MGLKCNESNADRIVRIIIAAALAGAVLAGFATGLLATVAWVVAGILFVTGLVGFCPLYAIVGFSTCPVRR